MGKGGRDEHTVVLQHPFDLVQGLSPAAARCAVRWTRSPHQRTGPHRAGGTYPARKSAASPIGYPALPRRSSPRRRPSPRCVPPRSRCVLAINPVPVASSSTVLAFTTGRISSYISSYAARSFSHEAVVPVRHFCPRNSCVLASLSFLLMLDLSNRYAQPCG